MPDTKLETGKREDYLNTLFKELDIKSFLKKEKETPLRPRKMAAELELPPISEMAPTKKDEAAGDQPDISSAETSEPMPASAPDAGTVPDVPPTPIEPEKPSVSDKDKDKTIDKIEEVQEKLQDAQTELKIHQIKEEVLSEVGKMVSTLQNSINDLKERKTPERGSVETDGAYRHHLFTMASRMLDEILPDLFEDVPEYSLIATQVSRLYEDGSVADGMIAMTATVGRDGYRYDFKIDVPVLNGLLHYPLFIERGQKIIPLTKPEIQKELESMSYRKMDVEKPYQKANIFNNIGENIYRKPDEQKFYETYQSPSDFVGTPSKSQWTTQRTIGVK